MYEDFLGLVIKIIFSGLEQNGIVEKKEVNYLLLYFLRCNYFLSFIKLVLIYLFVLIY